MGLFGWFKKNKKEEVDEGGQEKFLKDTPAEDSVKYSMPEARKPVVVASDKPAPKKASTKVEKKKSALKKEAPKTEDKKPAPKKEAHKAEDKKPAPKEETAKAEEKKPAPKKKAVKVDEPVTQATEAIEVEAEDTVTEGKATRNGTFDIKKTKDGRFVFNLYSANKVIIATSQIYSSSQSAKVGVKSVMANALKSPIEDSTLKHPNPQPFPKWEIYEDKAGEFRFRLYASNGSCVCHAKAGYATKSNCKRGIESIIRLAADAQIDKSY